MCSSNPCLLVYFCLSVSSLRKPCQNGLRAHATPIFISGTTLFQIRSQSEALEISNSTYHFVGHSWPRRVSTEECSCLCFLFWVAWRNARLPQWLRGKESACNARPRFDPWVRRICWPRRVWEPTPVFLLGESCVQRSLVGYDQRSRKESDTTEVTGHSPKAGRSVGAFTCGLMNSGDFSNNIRRTNEQTLP